MGEEDRDCDWEDCVKRDLERIGEEWRTRAIARGNCCYGDGNGTMVNLSTDGGNSGERIWKHTVLLTQNVARMHLCACVMVWARTLACMPYITVQEYLNFYSAYVLNKVKPRGANISHIM